MGEDEMIKSAANHKLAWVEQAKQLKIAGDSNDQIATKMGITERQVRELLDKVVWTDPKPVTRDDFNEEDVMNSYWDQFVPKEYDMDPEAEDVLYAERLRDGMVVLIERDNFRENIPHIQKFGNPTALANALKNNRWTTVSNLSKYSEKEITFIGVYSDGRKTQHMTRLTQAWYVKLDSIPDEDDEVYYTERQIAIMPDEQLESIRGSGSTTEEAELKESLASLVETGRIAWQNILDILKEGIKSEADLLDEAASRLYEKTKDLKFSEKPEDLGDQTDRLPPEPGDLSNVMADGHPYFRKATVDDVVRNFVRKNLDFFKAKDVHSLNELYPSYNFYCDQVGTIFKLSREEFYRKIHGYFEQGDLFREEDVQFIGFVGL